MVTDKTWYHLYCWQPWTFSGQFLDAMLEHRPTFLHVAPPLVNFSYNVHIFKNPKIRFEGMCLLLHHTFWPGAKKHDFKMYTIYNNRIFFCMWYAYHRNILPSIHAFAKCPVFQVGFLASHPLVTEDHLSSLRCFHQVNFLSQIFHLCLSGKYSVLQPLLVQLS